MMTADKALHSLCRTTVVLSACGAEKPEGATSKIASEHLNQYDTPLGFDATASPTQVQLLSSFQKGAGLSKESFLAMSRLQERERNDSQNEVSRDTAMRASQKQRCWMLRLLLMIMIMVMMMMTRMMMLMMTKRQ